MVVLSAAKNSVLHILLALAIALNPIFAVAADKTNLPVHTPQFDGQSYEGMDYFPRPGTADHKEWTNYIKTQIAAAEKSNMELVTESGEDLVELMIQYKNFFLECREQIYTEIRDLGFDAFLKRLESNMIKFTDPKLGLMEFTTVDGEPVGKIVHEKSGVAFVVYDEDAVDKNSKHFKQYIARQHYDAGTTRKNSKYIDENGKKQKVKAGRDALILGIKRDDTINPDSIEISPRQRGFRQWLKATYKSPTSYDYKLGFTSGFAQYASVAALATLVAMVLPGMEHKSSPQHIAAFTFMYGTMIGIWSSFFHNWRSRGPKIQRDLKNMSISVGYYFGVYILSGGHTSQITLTDFSIDPMHIVNYVQSMLEHPAVMLPFAHFGTNFWLNNEGKSVGYYVADVYKEERSDLGKVWWMRQRDVNRQFLYYLPNNWIKFVDQVWFAWTLGPAISGEYPWWTPLLSVGAYAGIVTGAMRGVNWWAYKYHPEAAKALKIREESDYYFWVDRLINKSKNFCSNLLTDSSSSK